MSERLSERVSESYICIYVNVFTLNMAFRVVPYCESKGWQRIYDKTRLDYRLKWCELKSSHTYYHFRTGESVLKTDFPTMHLYTPVDVSCKLSNSDH